MDIHNQITEGLSFGNSDHPPILRQLWLADRLGYGDYRLTLFVEP